jgi:hypothetical protein
MIRVALAIAVVGLPLAAVAAQSDQGPPRWMANIARKQQVIMYGTPRAPLLPTWNGWHERQKGRQNHIYIGALPREVSPLARRCLHSSGHFPAGTSGP